MTLRGMKADSEQATLDITDLRFSPAQVTAIITMLLTLFGSLGITVWRVDDVGRRVEKIETVVTASSQTLSTHQSMILRNARDIEKLQDRQENGR